jgi:predicted PhzF superfamily epimerase YddE/YHI9
LPEQGQLNPRRSSLPRPRRNQVARREPIVATKSMNIERLSAFSHGEIGGNPAGVLITDVLPPPAEMQRIAREVGYSETAFAAREDAAWRVRYFPPEAEVPFCGHATIALGAALAKRHGDGEYGLKINRGTISVEGRRQGHGFAIARRCCAQISVRFPYEVASPRVHQLNPRKYLTAGKQKWPLQGPNR